MPDKEQVQVNVQNGQKDSKKKNIIIRLTSLSESVMDEVLSWGSMAEITGNAE